MARLPGRNFLTMYLYTHRLQSIIENMTLDEYVRIFLNFFLFISALGEFRQREREDVEMRGDLRTYIAR